MGRPEVCPIAFVGVGRMAEALIRRFMAVGALADGDVVGTHHSPAKARELSESLGVEVLTNNIDAVKRCQSLVLCVRPNQLPSLAGEIAEYVGHDHAVMSIAVGVPPEWLRTVFPACSAAVHVHPSSLIFGANQGISFLAADRQAVDAVVERIKDLFSCMGIVATVPEDQLDICAVLAGCGPAFLAHVIQAWRDVGTAHGLSPNVLDEISSTSLSGMASMLESHSLSMVDFERLVATPGGVTQTGIERLESEGLRACLGGTVEECLSKIAALRHMVTGTSR